MANISPSRYFNQYAYGPQQKLIEDLIIQAIRQKGLWIYYLPREIVKMDNVYHEDTLSLFNDAIQIEMYPKDTDGFQGGGDLLSKFGGLQINDQITFTISKKRFEQVRTEKLTTENGLNIMMEDVNRYEPNQTSAIRLEDASSSGYIIPYEKPRAGDLIYFPLVKKIFEIRYVEHENQFYQFGKLMTYDLTCELFEYSAERFDTNFAEIDNLEDAFSTNLLFSEIISEDGFSLVQENGDAIFLEDANPENFDSTANNNLFRFEAEDIIDWSEKSPFIDMTKGDKW